MTRRSVLGAWISALRPLQWVKNGLVFAAPLFAYSLDLESLPSLFYTFLVFCGVSSGVYLVNDLFDLDIDRLHPLKRTRPMASGEISPRMGALVAAVLLLSSLFWSWLLSPALASVAAAYVLIQIGYNAAFKHLFILDIMTLSVGFILRAVAGAVIARVPMSPWFLFCVGLLSFYIVLEKRKGELKRMNASGVTTRPILRHYTLAYLEQIKTVILACLLLGYALWTIQGARTEWMMLTLPFVLYGVLRYQYLSHSEIVERPEEALFTDRPLLLDVILWILTCFTIVALKHLGYMA